jgi:dolichol-phosphate mannosyltransferase
VKTLIVLPSFNEKENINDLIKAILAISKLFYIVVVDDNSPDGTYEAVEKLKN